MTDESLPITRDSPSAPEAPAFLPDAKPPDRENTEKNFGSDMEQMRNAKKNRLKSILEFACNELYTNQADLCDWLYARGCGCNQGQLSKDLDQLGLAPYVDRHGEKHLGRRNRIISARLEERYVKIFEEAVLSVRQIQHLVMIETIPGCAQAAATVIESADWPEVLSITYGLSSLTLICMTDQAAADIYFRIKEGTL